MDRFDYARDDTGNLVLLEHVNLTIPFQGHAGLRGSV
jgi:hypothetical protein